MTERRSFLKLMLIVGASFALAGNVVGELVNLIGGKVSKIPFVSGRFQSEIFALGMSQAPERQKLGGKWRRDWIMVFDLDRCDGCKYCTRACNIEHNNPPEQEWIKVYDLKEGHLAPFFPVPRPCQHCENAPCIRVCPVGATHYDVDGLVAMDKYRCIGCRLCMAACPYSARYFNWRVPETTVDPGKKSHDILHWEYQHVLGTVEKCGFCRHFLEKGRVPACVEGCPHLAIFFGDLAEDTMTNGRETHKISEVFARRQPFRLLEDLGTEPRVYYLSRFQSPKVQPPLEE